MIPVESKPKKRRAPSPQVAAGVGGGAFLGVLVVWIASLFGLQVPAEIAAGLGPFLGGLVQYFMPGGRQT